MKPIGRKHKPSGQAFRPLFVREESKHSNTSAKIYITVFTRTLTGVEYTSGNSVCLSVHLSVITSIFFLIQTLSSRNLLQSTLVTQPLPRYLMFPIHVPHARQSTGPPMQMERIMSQTFLFHLGSSYVSTWHFFCNIQVKGGDQRESSSSLLTSIHQPAQTSICISIPQPALPAFVFTFKANQNWTQFL